MSYLTSKGRYMDAKDIVMDPLEGAAVTVDGYSAVQEMAERRTLYLKLDVTSVSASDTLDVTIQSSNNNSDWYTAGTFTQVTGAGAQRKDFVVGRYCRALFDVTGASISIACTLRGEAI